MIGRRTMLAGTGGAVSSLVPVNASSHREATSVSHSVAIVPTFGLMTPPKKWLYFSYVPHPALGTPMAAWPGMITSRNSVWVGMRWADGPSGASDEWSLQVDGTTPLTLTLGQLKSDFSPVEMEPLCSTDLGNESCPPFRCRLKGVWLSDILAASGIPECVQGTTSKAGGPSGFESVFWFDKADDGDSILAYEMNGSPPRSDRPVHLLTPIVPGLYEI